MTQTRRELLCAVPAMAAAVQRLYAAPVKTWNPKVGILCRYTEANIGFAAAEGFKSLELSAAPKSRLDAAAITDQEVRTPKASYPAPD